MIRYLQKLRASKGFTMAELIIVIAIMAVLMAVILPAFSSDDAEKQAAETYASDFYASLQYNMTRYQLTEYHLTPQLQQCAQEYLAGSGPNPFVMFNPKFGGNVFNYNYLWIEVAYDDGIEYVKVGKTLGDLITDVTATTSDHPFEQLLQKDLEDTMNKATKGHYYAVVMCDYSYDISNLIEVDGDGKPLGGYGDLKVLTAHYCEEQLPESTTRDDLMFTEFTQLQNGIICGTCSSDIDGASYVGTIGTHFLNINSINGNPPMV